MHRRYKLALLLLVLLVPCVAHGAGSVRSLGVISSNTFAGAMRFRQYPSATADIMYDKRGFIATCVQAATASNNSVCQIFNPVASGKYILLDLIRCWHTSGTTVDLYVPRNTARTTLVGGGTNIYVGNANTSVAQIYKDIIASLSPVSSAIDQVSIGATPASNVNFGAVPGLPPGSGVEVQSLTQNIGLTCEFWWHEIAPE